MIRVLGRRNSANVQKVMWTLGELGLPYQRDDIGGGFGYPDDYPNPNRVVPTIHDEGLIIWESGACVRHLARNYGAGTLWPSDPAQQALAEMWMEWHRSEIAYVFFPLFQKLIRGVPSTPEELDTLAERCGAIFSQLDQQLQGESYICGKQLTVADIVNGAIAYRYFTLPIERPPLTAMHAWYDRLCERSAYQHHVMIPYGDNPQEWQQQELANAGIQ